MELAAGKVALAKKCRRAAATTDKYEQWLKQGQVWLSNWWTAKAIQSIHCIVPTCQSSLTGYTDNLRGAFDRTPNCASPGVLALFITTNSFGEEERGKSMVWQIYWPFKQFWEQVFVPLFLAHYSSLTLSSIISVTQIEPTRAIGSGTELNNRVMVSSHFLRGWEDHTSHKEQRMCGRNVLTLLCDEKAVHDHWLVQKSNKQWSLLILKKLGSLDGAQLHNLLPLPTKHFFMCVFSTSGWNLWTS